MNLKILVPILVISSLMTGCATTTSTKSLTQVSGTSSPSSQPTSSSAQQVDPALYLTCAHIYQGVSQAVKDKGTENFDTDLEAITKTAEKSPQSSPNGVLFQDANTVVAMDDAMNGDGQPAHLYDAIQTALNKMGKDLQKFKPKTN